MKQNHLWFMDSSCLVYSYYKWYIHIFNSVYSCMDHIHDIYSCVYLWMDIDQYSWPQNDYGLLFSFSGESQFFFGGSLIVTPSYAAND